MIEVINVYKSFGTQKVLDGISLTVNPAEILAVVGPSGVGKSVLLKLIMGLMPVDSGEILVNGRSITKAKNEKEKNEIRKSLGVLFQSSALLDSLTVFENVAFPLQERTKLKPREIHAKVFELLETLGLVKYHKANPQELSIGIKKRIGIARALITEPKIFLFDEPNTGLDPKDGQAVYDLIKECEKIWQFAGLVISHELPEVFQVSDKVAMLLGGKIVASGTPEEITTSDNPIVEQFLEGKVDGPIKIE